MIMEKLRKAAFILACICLVLAALVHVLSIMEIDLQEEFPFVLLLHLLVFVCFVPGFISLFELQQAQSPSTSGRRRLTLPLLKQFFAGTPWWMFIIFALFLVYALVNFQLFAMESEGGGPGFIDGVYVLHNHGQIIREISQEEYHLFRANELRGFSGHWMAFFSFSMLLLWPRKDVPTG